MLSKDHPDYSCESEDSDDELVELDEADISRPKSLAEENKEDLEIVHDKLDDETTLSKTDK